MLLSPGKYLVQSMTSGGMLRQQMEGSARGGFVGTDAQHQVQGSGDVHVLPSFLPLYPHST